MKISPRSLRFSTILLIAAVCLVAATSAFAAAPMAASPALAAPAAVSSSLPAKPASTMSFTVSMAQPTMHLFHVAFRCDGLKGETQDFKMPVWTPGYYVIMDYPKNVVSFRAEDGAGRALAWEKTAKNVWRVKSRGAATVTVSYDVYAFRLFCAESFLDDSEAFINPPSCGMHRGYHAGKTMTMLFSQRVKNL